MSNAHDLSDGQIETPIRMLPWHLRWRSAEHQCKRAGPFEVKRFKFSEFSANRKTKLSAEDANDQVDRFKRHCQKRRQVDSIWLARSSTVKRASLVLTESFCHPKREHTEEHRQEQTL